MLTRLTICTLCIVTNCSLSYFPFGFEGGILVLIAPVPGHCILVTFSTIWNVKTVTLKTFKTYKLVSRL